MCTTWTITIAIFNSPIQAHEIRWQVQWVHDSTNIESDKARIFDFGLESTFINFALQFLQNKYTNKYFSKLQTNATLVCICVRVCVCAGDDAAAS